MRRESWIYLPLALFFGVMTVMYFFFGRFDDGTKIEWTGVSTLALTTLMTLMIGSFYSLTGKKMDDRPEDRLNAEVVDGAGEIGFFPPASMWPFWCALVAGIIFLGPVFGWWISILGFGLGIWAVCGWVYQYYVGDYQH